MTDGWNARPVTPPPANGSLSGSSPWWSDALRDPWRDPYAPAQVVVPAAATNSGPAPERVADPDAPRRGLGSVMAICLVTALLAGSLGGALGYLFAVRSGVGGGGGGALGASPAQAPAAANRAPDSQAGIVKKVQPSVVTVRVTGAIGSGFVASAGGYVITNDHVVEGADGAITVAFVDGSTAKATLVGHDQESDIAVIKVAKSGLTPVTFGNSDSIAVGDPVFAFGSPLDLENTVTGGIVSALDRPIEANDPGGPTRYYAAIQTDAAVNQGNSGGPLVDAAGRVVGMNSVIRSVGGTETEAGNIGLAFAIPINQARRMATDIIDHGKARRTVIGAEVTTSATGAGTGGAKLRTVEPSGPAAAAGLKAGDTITKLDGHVLNDGTDLIALVRSYAPGATIPIEFRRGSDTKTTSVTLVADAN
ncbi:trypsin-like peptidase domain-containing protein [Actinoplanes sp. NPDC051411]|uniref:S1C family serine protease n=1 Tax=Actinoplanes sp. NPDC051411 TaxID=3155522 RepID=UPI0034457266